MKPSSQLPIVGTVSIALGAALGVGGVGSGPYFRTHLPNLSEPLAFGIAGGLTVLWLLSAVVSGAAFVGFGWALRRGWWQVAVVGGGLTCLEGIRVVSLTVAGAAPWWASAMVAIVGGYLVTLGLATRVERRAVPAQPGAPGTRLDRGLLWQGAAAATVAAVVIATGWGLGAAARRQANAYVEAQRKDQDERNKKAREERGKAEAAYLACATTDRLEQYCASPYAVAISADGGRVGVASYTSGPDEIRGGSVSAWDRASGRRVWRTPLTGNFADPYQTLAFSPDGRYVAHTLRGWGTLLSATDGSVVRTIEPCHEPGGVLPPARGTGGNLGIAFSPDLRHMAVGGSGICVVDLATGALIKPLEALRVGCYFGREWLTFSHDGSRLYALCGAMGIVAWDVESGKPVAQFSAPPPDPARAELPPRLPAALYVSADQSALVTVDFGPPTVLVHWDAKARAQTRVLRVSLQGATTPSPGARIAFTADGRKAIVPGRGLQVVDTDSGQVRRLLGDESLGLVDVSNAGDVVVALPPSNAPTKPRILVIGASELE